MRTEFQIEFPAAVWENISDIQKQMYDISGELKTSSSDDKLHEQHRNLLFQHGAIIEQICNEIRKQCPSVDSVFASSLAGQLLEKLLHEFVKNSIDAKARAMHFTLSQDNNQCKVEIKDNGTTLIPAHKLGKYDWVKAVFTKSEKDITALGGCHYALAFVANFLEMVDQKSELTLTQNTEQMGACVSFVSSAQSCDLSQVHFANYILEIITDLYHLSEKKDPRVTAHVEQLTKMLDEKNFDPTLFRSQRPALQCSASCDFNTPVSSVSAYPSFFGSPAFPPETPASLSDISPANTTPTPTPTPTPSRRKKRQPPSLSI